MTEAEWNSCDDERTASDNALTTLLHPSTAEEAQALTMSIFKTRHKSHLFQHLHANVSRRCSSSRPSS
jgi:hypothetical protein